MDDENVPDAKELNILTRQYLDDVSIPLTSYKKRLRSRKGIEMPCSPPKHWHLTINKPKINWCSYILIFQNDYCYK